MDNYEKIYAEMFKDNSVVNNTNFYNPSDTEIDSLIAKAADDSMQSMMLDYMGQFRRKEPQRIMKVSSVNVEDSWN